MIGRRPTHYLIRHTEVALGRFDVRVTQENRDVVDRPALFEIEAAGALVTCRARHNRHTATLLLAQGDDPRTIMETRGHSQISLR